jgi:hypothetical protein
VLCDWVDHSSPAPAVGVAVSRIGWVSGVDVPTEVYTPVCENCMKLYDVEVVS